MSYRCLTMNLYSFVSIVRVLEFFDAVQGFYTNSVPESNRLFVFILLTRSNMIYSNWVGILGSVLGPILFRLYIHDIYVSSEKLNVYLFANDTNILFANKNLKSLEQIVNQELCNLCIYLASSK